MNKEKLSILAALLGNSIFGLSFLFSKIALGYVRPTLLLAIRFDIAFLVITLLVLTKLIKVDLKGKNIKGLILLGILQPVIYFLCENNGLQYVSSSISGIIIAIIPVVAFFTGYFILGEKFSIQQLLWGIFSVLGVAIISMQSSDSGNVQLIGIILLIGAVISGATFTTMSRKYANDFTPVERTYIMFFVGAVFFTILALIKKESFIVPMDIKFVLGIVYLSIVSSIGAFLLLNISVQHLPVRQASSFASITSIISVVAGVVVLHETITFIQYIGIIMILIGVYKVNNA